MSDSETRGPKHPPDGSVAFLAGGGELGARMRALDWTRTPLGAAASWPQSLKTAVRIMLTSRQPIWIGWGEELIYLYNDAYKSIIGGKHPEALGEPTSAVWREIWNDIAPMLSTAMSGDEGTYVEEQLLIMERHGFPEETYYTFSYSPIPEDTAVGGRAGGIICANTDDTQRVIGERQIALLRELAAGTADARTSRQACQRSARALATDPRDVLFALIYMSDPETNEVSLSGHCGVDVTRAGAPTSGGVDAAHWPLEAVLRAHEPQLVTDLQAVFGDAVPSGAWPRPAAQAAVLPIDVPGEAGQGALVVGLNPFRLFDDDYRGFLGLVAGQIAASVANARAYESERKRAESLAELDRAKTTFFSNVSHEFRTPLTLMLGPVEDLLARPEPALAPEARELVTLAHRNGLRLKKLVNTLLDFSRIEAGRVQACYEPTVLSSFTGELASNFRSACQRAGLRLVVDCSALPEPVYVDRDMWEKVVLNLVSNAFKFTLEGEIVVRMQAAGDRAWLTVRDTGTGIPAEEMPKLFERFHRVEGVRGRTQEGSGIGLALVQELVRLHGGAVRADSELGRGTTFTVEVPFGTRHLPAERIGGSRTGAPTSLGVAPFVEEALRWVPEETSAPSHADVPSPGAAAAPGAQAHILLADDNADMREYVRRLLEAEYEVSAVADGVAALAFARAEQPDLILTDVMMPGLDGFGLLRELRADPRTRELPVILLSARAGQEARVEGLRAGADDYLTKPFGARELVARVSTHLALARLRRESAETLRESEARFRNMADNSPVIIWMTDPDGDCVYLNEQWYRFTGTVPPAGLGLHWLDSIHPDDRAASGPAFLAANARREPFRLEYRLRRHDGDYRWAIDSAAPRFGANGEFLGYIGSVTDVSELKRIEMELREADRRKDVFLATLAHELRNPLAPIRTGLELLKLADDDPATRKKVRDTMERQTQQLITLVDDLLDVSRITRGKLELRTCRVSAADVLRSAIEAARPLLDEAGHQLTVCVAEEPLELEADPHRLAQVLSNLLNNAVKYTPEGGRIQVSASREAGWAVIAVRDSGVGIPPDMRDRIFEMFAQIDRPLERGHTGLGIGLTLARSLVEMHRGELEVRSEGSERGSEFRVRLPLATTASEALVPPAAEPSVALAKQRVLIVDDNAAAAETLSLVVEILGCEARTARDGREAIAVAEAFRPDLVLMDLGMPNMNGYEAARHIRAQPWGKSMHLVALTGWGQEDDKRRTREAGFDHHLVKPAEPATVRALLAARGTARAMR